MSITFLRANLNRCHLPSRSVAVSLRQWFRVMPEGARVLFSFMISFGAVYPASVDSMNFAWIAGRFLLAGLGLFFAFVSIGGKQPEVGLFDSGSANRFDASGNLSADDKTAEDLVKNWDKPKFVLFISGRQHGYIHTR